MTEDPEHTLTVSECGDHVYVQCRCGWTCHVLPGDEVPEHHPEAGSVTEDQEAQ